MINSYHNPTVCYTDGLKCKNKIGYAFSINNQIRLFRHRNSATIYTAVLQAILQCLSDMMNLTPPRRAYSPFQTPLPPLQPSKTFTPRTDHQRQWPKRPRVYRETKKYTAIVRTFFTWIFIHVPYHVIFQYVDSICSLCFAVVLIFRDSRFWKVTSSYCFLCEKIK